MPDLRDMIRALTPTVPLPEGLNTATGTNGIDAAGDVLVYVPPEVDRYFGSGGPFLPTAGGTMLGPLILAENPVQAMEAATKQYVDALLESPAFTGIPTAPTAPVSTTDTQLATTAFVHAVVASGGTFVDAPADGSAYGRLNNNWARVLPLTGGTITGELTAAGPLNWISTGSTALRAAQDRTAEQVNVKDFGAKGDGTTDDTTAIQVAVNRGGTIYFPPGRYLISTPIVSPNLGPLTVIGDGFNASEILQITPGANGWNHTVPQYFQMFGITMLCNGVGGTALNLDFSGISVSQLTLRDVQIIGNGNTTTNFWHDGISANAASIMTLDHVLITGTNGGQLANIGNGLYLRPPQAPAPDLGSYVFLIFNSNISYYQSAVVADSTGHIANLQGIVLDWVNSNHCMQFVIILGTALEVVISKCQYEGFGAAVHAEGAETLVIRDCLFFIDPPGSMAIPGQTPQDVIYADGGNNWWISDNNFILQPNAVVGYFFNFLNGFNTVKVRDNYVWTQNATAAGWINIGANSANIEESGSVPAFWGAWPMVTNANAQGGYRNLATLGTLATLMTHSADTWQSAGAYIGWNFTAGEGATDFLTSQGGGPGGFNFYNVVSSPTATPTLLATLGGTGNFRALGGIDDTAIGIVTPATGAFTSVTASSGTFTTGAGSLTANTVVAEIASVAVSFASISGTQWQQQGAWTAWNYQGTSGLNGETDFINSRGGGLGGFAWFTTLSSSSATPALVATLNPAGTFTAAQYVGTQAGGGAGAAFVSRGAGGAGYAWYDTTGPVDAKLFDIFAASGTIYFRLLLDNQSNFNDFLTITRSGDVPAVVNLSGTNIGLLGAVTANSIDNTPIGGTTPAAGTFTALTVSSSTTGFLNVASNLANIYPPIGTGLSGSIGWNFLSGVGETDYWNNYLLAAESHIFWQRTGASSATRLMDISPTGAVTAYAGFIVSSATGPTIRAGAGAPAGTQPAGSLWLRSDGAVGTHLYVSAGGGTWNAVAGV